MSPSSTSKIESPCVRRCCLDQDDICIGCFRTLEEIKSWLQQTTAEKKQTLIRCQQRREQHYIKYPHSRYEP